MMTFSALPAVCTVRAPAIRLISVTVPVISRFFGITIRMFWKEHGAPHFHAECGGSEASLSIDSLEILEGRLPPRIRRLTRRWAMLHRPELRENWLRLERHGAAVPIAGLGQEDE